MKTKLPTLLLTSLVCLLAACGPKEPRTPRIVAPAGDPNKPLRIEHFALGTRLGPHGGIAKGMSDTAFAPGQLIYLAMELTNAPIGTVVRVVWKAQGDLVLGEETKEVLPGQRFMSFAADSSSLPLEPKYHVEVFANGKSLAQLEFNLVMAAV